MKKNLSRIEFENKCKAYERRTLFLRIFVIYIIPLYMILGIFTICALIAQKQIIFSLFEAIKITFMYITRKEAFKLTKKGYYFLIISWILILISGLITEGINTLYIATVSFMLFFIYIHKRSFLFNVY